MKFKFFDDKKRAICSRLLIRQASASALGHTSFEELTIKRTKGRKPFLDSPLPPEKEAPNWNANCSHEGSWVVCASKAEHGPAFFTLTGRDCRSHGGGHGDAGTGTTVHRC